MDQDTEQVIGACIEVHRQLGSGLLEAVYEEAIVYELGERGVAVRRQVQVPVLYKGHELATSLRLDLLVESRDLRRGPTILEVKSVERLAEIHEAQLLTYLRLTGFQVGLLVNFNSTVLARALRRVVNNYHP